MQKLVREGQLLERDTFCERQQIGRSRIDADLATHRLFCIDIDGTQYFPAFYADPSIDRRGLRVVTKLLAPLPAGSKLQFFLSPRASLLGLTPLEALSHGRVDLVKRAASAFVET